MPWGLTGRKRSLVRCCRVQGWAPTQDSSSGRSWWNPSPWQTSRTGQGAGSGRLGPSNLYGCGGTSWSVWLSSVARPEPCRAPRTNQWALEYMKIVTALNFFCTNSLTSLLSYFLDNAYFFSLRHTELKVNGYIISQKMAKIDCSNWQSCRDGLAQ